MFSASDINIVRTMIGDFYQAAVSDILVPAPDGATRIFRLSFYPLGASLPNLYQVSLDTNTTTIIPSASWSVLDSENGVILTTFSPSSSLSYIMADYYTWAFLSDATIISALTTRSGNWRRAAIDLVMYILSDPQGAFFKVLQTGDDSYNGGQFNIPRLQAVVAEMWRQEEMAEFAGSENIQFDCTNPVLGFGASGFA